MPWMTSELTLRSRERSSRPTSRPLLDACGIDSTILVQAACTDADTDSMFEQADAQRVDRRRHRLGRPHELADRARARLDELARRPKLRGIRHLIHEEDDPHWILRDDVLESIALLEEPRPGPGAPVRLSAPSRRRAGARATLPGPDDRDRPSRQAAAPHRADGRLDDAASQRAAAHGNVAAKISGLNTVLTSAGWTASDLRDAVEVAVECFGPDRLMCGSDWPVRPAERRLRESLARNRGDRRLGRRRRRRAPHTGRHPRPPLPARRHRHPQPLELRRRRRWSR